MKITLLKIFAYIWLTGAGLLILGSLALIWRAEGFEAVQAILSPFNLINWGFTLLVLSPGIGALVWADKLSEKSP